MEKIIYELEVGVHLKPEDKEFDCYEISGITPITNLAYYDENRLDFINIKQAIAYAKEYVKNGNNNTYAFIYSEMCKLDEKDIINIKNNAYLDKSFDIPEFKDLDYYIYKDDNGNIITKIDNINKE